MTTDEQDKALGKAVREYNEAERQRGLLARQLDEALAELTRMKDGAHRGEFNAQKIQQRTASVSSDLVELAQTVRRIYDLEQCLQSANVPAFHRRK